MTDWIDAGAVADIAPGEYAVVEAEDTSIAVVNLDGMFYAIENVCTHDGETLTGGEIDGDDIICPRHGASFCIRTGEVTAPPAYENIATFPVRIREGRVETRDNRWD